MNNKKQQQQDSKWIEKISLLISALSLILTGCIGKIAYDLEKITNQREQDTQPLNLTITEKPLSVHYTLSETQTGESKQRGVHFRIGQTSKAYSGKIKNMYIVSVNGENIYSKYVDLEDITAENGEPEKDEIIEKVSMDYNQPNGTYDFNNEDYFKIQFIDEYDIQFFTASSDDRRYYFVFEGFSGEKEIVVFSYSAKRDSFITFQKRELFDRDIIAKKLDEFGLKTDIDRYIDTIFNELVIINTKL